MAQTYLLCTHSLYSGSAVAAQMGASQLCKKEQGWQRASGTKHDTNNCAIKDQFE